jgi:hypothetical protein
MEAVVAVFSAHTVPTNDWGNMIIIRKTSLNTAHSKLNTKLPDIKQISMKTLSKANGVEIWGYHSDDYEVHHLLGYVAVYIVDRY